MPYQCVKCSRIIPAGSRELLEGCANCHGKFFFYIREEQLDLLKNQKIEIPEKEKKQIEQDLKDIAGIEEGDVPVILDFESVRVTGEGKFEIDLVNLFNSKIPLVYKMDEGKYLIDLAKTIKKEDKE